ncbi:MAG: mercury(II) reductase [Thaumarchaeota archaeon 13_1_40CM_3_50_5]|nr:MAG: mercury(II) reductase [Thaumarchaeota archaeon 13_1_40CM_3_50_5]
MFDLVILGSGSAAFAAALKAADHGAKTAMIERSTLGGTCVNVGCVPSKNLLRAGELRYYDSHREFPGISPGSTKLEFNKIIEQKNQIVRRLRKEKYSDVLKSLPSAKLFRGDARFVSKTRVKVDGINVDGKKFVVATGSSPRLPRIPGIENVSYLTNAEALSLRNKPASMVVLGGRALGLEFAQMYSHMGTEVALLQRSDRIIPEEEPEVSQALRQYLEDEGIKIKTGVEVKRVYQTQGEKVIVATANGRKFEAKGDELLLATGRDPNTNRLGLETVPVRLRKDGAVKVDREMHTTARHVWAAGDVIGEPMLETIAAKEGATAAENALLGTHRKIDFLPVPRAIFTSPQVASVGLTEKEAHEGGYECACRTIPMSKAPKAIIIRDTRGLVKMVVEASTGRILGVHILAENAADIIHEAVLAVKHKLTVDDIIDTVHVFPTMTESIKLAATSFRKDIDQLSCCAE